MKILALDNYGQEKNAKHNTVYGYVNGERLFFKSGFGQELQLCAEPFISAMLLPAMQTGAKIEIPRELEASAEFLRNINSLQDIFSTWFPYLSRVKIDVGIRRASVPNHPNSTAAFFSGGIDACYTLLKHDLSLTHLVYVKGIDMQLEGNELWQQCLNRNQQIALRHNKTLVPIESNVRFFIRRLSNSHIGWSMAQGCGLASIAHVLGFPRIIINSSNTYKELHPLGSHPLSDPLFSSDSVEIIHKGCEASRHKKLIEISKAEELLTNLRVCWQDKGFNCGHCDKCLHLRMSLYLLKLEAGGLKPLTDFKELSAAHTGTHGEYIEWEDNLILAEKVGDKKAIKALRKILNRYKKKQLSKLVDEIYFNGKMQKLKSKSKSN